ncbi:pitrilysin family protein [Fodinicurvata sp. EGI_FJ10296]|uniref:M16 family metallopeptidase n=1 Tax=Fodinicurvata sp. EGI_FJ10296 TaxID=3231908 RepID=UPI0034527E3B
MTIKRANAAATALLAVATGAGLAPSAGAEVFRPDVFELDNGLTVVVVTNRTAPVVSHMLWYKVGAADEEPGVSGIAHFLEHLMFRGTETVPDGEFSRIVQREGARSNAMTSWDYTAYFQNVASDRLGRMMELEADRMANLAITDEVVAPERNVILEERGQVVESRPSSRLNEQMYATLFQNHPYGIPIIGWRHEIEDLSINDARAFYDRWYAPNNAVLVLAGDIDVEAARPLVEETYGRIPARDVPERTRLEEPDSGAEFSVTLTSDQVQLPNWRRFYLAPTYTDDPNGHAYALQVLDELLGTGTTSRLYRSLVVEQEIAVAAGTSYRPAGVDQGPLVAYMTPRGDTGMAALEEAFEAEIERLLTEGLTEEEVATAKDRLTISSTFARDSLMAPVYAFGQALATGGTIDDVERWPSRIDAISADDVMAAAEAVFGANGRHVTGYLLPEDPDAAIRLDEPVDPDAVSPDMDTEIVQ